jgi:hypothetical protein
MTEHAEMVRPDTVAERYRRYREIPRELNRRLITMLLRNALRECAARLKYDAMIDFAGGDDISVLVDFAIYDYRIRGGTNAVERLVKQAPWPTCSDERVILEAMLRARFTVLRVVSTLPDVGVRAEDLLYEREFLLTDVRLSNTATDDQHVAARVLEFPEFQMTTGAALPFDPMFAYVLVEGFRKIFPEGFSAKLREFKPADHARLAAQIIALAMEDPEDLMEEASKTREALGER